MFVDKHIPWLNSSAIVSNNDVLINKSPKLFYQYTSFPQILNKKEIKKNKNKINSPTNCQVAKNFQFNSTIDSLILPHFPDLTFILQSHPDQSEIYRDRLIITNLYENNSFFIHHFIFRKEKKL